MMWIVGMAMFTILLVTGNTMAQAVRERTNELAVLKTLGFGDGRILRLVLLESALIAIVGGAFGLAVAYLLITRGRSRPEACCRRSTSRRRTSSPASRWCSCSGWPPAPCRPARPAACASSTR